MHKTLYVEMKVKSNCFLYALWEKTVRQAEAEGKTPVVVIRRPGKQGRPEPALILHIVKEGDIDVLVDEREKVRAAEEKG